MVDAQATALAWTTTHGAHMALSLDERIVLRSSDAVHAPQFSITNDIRSFGTNVSGPHTFTLALFRRQLVRLLVDAIVLAALLTIMVWHNVIVACLYNLRPLSS